MNCKIITINGSGYIPNGEKVKGMEIPQKRRAVVDKVIRDECPAIIFIQESTIQLKNFCTRYLKDLKYESIGPKDAGIIFDTSKFDFVEDPTTRLRQIYESKVIREESADIFPRMCARILKGKGVNAQPTLFVCWHGPHKETLDEKKKLYDDLCLLLSLYASEKRIQVVIGGDFNLNLNKDKNLEKKPAYPDTLAVIDYKKLERRPKKIDFILTSPTITVVDCKPVDAFSITKKLFPVLKEPFVTAVLDHDPIVVNAIIPNQEELNLTEPYKNIEPLNQFSDTQTKPYYKGFEPLDQLSMTKPYTFFDLHYYLSSPFLLPLLNQYYNDHLRFLLPMPPPSQYHHYHPPYPCSPPPSQYHHYHPPYPCSPPPSQYHHYHPPYPCSPPPYQNYYYHPPYPCSHPPYQNYNYPPPYPCSPPPYQNYYYHPPYPCSPPSYQNYNYPSPYPCSPPPYRNYNYPPPYPYSPPPYQNHNYPPPNPWSMPHPKPYFHYHLHIHHRCYPTQPIS